MRRLTDKERLAIQKALRLGLATQAELATQYGVSQEAISYTKTTWKPKPQVTPLIPRRKILELALNYPPHSIDQIADILKVNPKTVASVIREDKHTFRYNELRMRVVEIWNAIEKNGISITQAKALLHKALIDFAPLTD